MPIVRLRNRPPKYHMVAPSRPTYIPYSYMDLWGLLLKSPMVTLICFVQGPRPEILLIGVESMHPKGSKYLQSIYLGLNGVTTS